MEINKEVVSILKDHKIDKSQGLLALLGIYFGLDIDTTCSEEVVKAINITHIVVRDHRTRTLTWNIPLFTGQETDFAWVVDWNKKFGRINKDREGAYQDVVKRMKRFFSLYPSFRKQDVLQATDNYFATVRDPQYLKSSDKFIFEGIGAMQKSLLLTWCQKLGVEDVTQQKGQVIR